MRPAESFVGQPIRSLQTALRVIAKDAGEELSVVPDGIYGQQTQDAVANFQRSRALPVSGVADQATWERIHTEYPDALTRISPAEPIQIILNPGKVFRLGDESYYIYLIQSMLLALSRIHGSMNRPEVNGVYDQITADAVSSFQQLSQLPPTGMVDKVTWKHLALQYPLAVNKVESENRQRR